MSDSFAPHPDRRLPFPQRTGAIVAAAQFLLLPPIFALPCRQGRSFTAEREPLSSLRQHLMRLDPSNP
ncbi:hypothetical protein ABTM60_19310, partial [Acinetobacter baumannii]